MRVEKKTGNLGCFVCPLPVFFSLNHQVFWQHYLIYLTQCKKRACPQIVGQARIYYIKNILSRDSNPGLSL